MRRYLFITLLFPAIGSCANPPSFEISNTTQRAPAGINESIPGERVQYQVVDSFFDSPNFLENSYSKEPKPRPTKSVRPECQLQNIKTQLQNTPPLSSEYIELLNNCEDSWDKSRSVTGLTIEWGRLGYKVEKHRRIWMLKIKTENGVTLRGLLSLKPDNQARPFIIAKCGVMCESGDRFSRYILMLLADQTPFNVLLLANQTTEEFLADNGFVGFGGAFGSESLFRIARNIKYGPSPLKRFASSVHVAGFSLGAHEATYATFLNNNHRQVYGAAPISSFIAFCPVMDVKSTNEALFQENPLLRFFFQKRFESLFRKMAKSTPFSKRIFDRIQNVKKETDFLAFQEEMVFENYQLFYQKFASQEPWSQPILNSKEDFITYSNLMNHLDDIKDPVLFWGASDDPIVKSHVNTEVAARLLQEKPNPNIIVHTSKNGAHCASPLNYGYAETGAFLERFVLAHSPEIQLEKKSATVNMVSPEANNQSPIIGWKWNIFKHSATAVLTVRRKGGIFEKLEVPLSAFGNSVIAPIKGVEIETGVRWLNAQAFPVVQNNPAAYGNAGPVIRVEWFDLPSNNTISTDPFTNQLGSSN